MSNMHFKIGTRSSKLAIWQAEWVRGKLKDHGISSDIIPIETRGDRILDVTISKIGSKGVFTEEIEQQLLDGNIDLAVHSAKDMQSTLEDPFELIAYGEREKPNDVLISDHSVSLMDPIRVGTSSTRRVSFLKYYYPHIEIVPMRGNLQTRIRKLEEGDCDALILAFAGVHRMGYESMIREELSLDSFIPAVGQGSVAVEICKTMGRKEKSGIRKALNHESTEVVLNAERSFLRTMDGGCSIPVFGIAQVNDTHLSMEGGIIDLDGKEIVKKRLKGLLSESAAIGQQLAEQVLEDGGGEILKEIRKRL
jgi:hydroxymethylbilane synthase